MPDYWQDVLETATTLRRELHQHPELSWQEERTAGRVRQTLTNLNIPWRPCATTGTIAWINPEGRAGPHIALRGDMDALPIVEDSGQDWSSTSPGCMHACGHDGHTATLLATAAWLKHHETSLPGPVTLLFQPAEEGGHGAREMIQDGALDSIDEIYGWHNWPAIEFGKLVCPDSIVMCGNGTFSIHLTGLGGHASQPELCKDPVLAASAITLALQQIVSRHIAPQQAAVVSVTSIEAPSGPTVIPQHAALGGSIRVADRQTRDTINQLITRISQQTAASYGVECAVTIEDRYNATINHPQQAAQVRTVWHDQTDNAGLDTLLATPIMASEDFSYYLEKTPGAFALIGSNDSKEHSFPCHSPHYDFNDRLIPLVTRLFAQLVQAPLPPSAI